MGIFDNMSSNDDLSNVRDRRNFGDGIPGVSSDSMNFENDFGNDSFDNGFGSDGFGSGGFGSGGFDSSDFSSDGFGSGGFGSGGFGSDGFGGGDFNSNPYGFQQNYNIPSNKPQRAEDDSAFVIGILKQVFSFCKEVLGVLNDFTALRRVRFGQFLFYSGCATLVVGLVSLFFSFLPSTQLIATGFFCCGIGGFSLLNGSQKMSMQEENISQEMGEGEEVDNWDNQMEQIFDSPTDALRDSTDFDMDSYSEEDEDDEDDGGEYNEGGYDDTDAFGYNPANEDSSFTEYEGLVDEVEDKVSPEEILNRIEQGANNRVTRRFLLDCASPLLESVTPYYSNAKKIPEDSKEFLSLCDWVEKAARIVAGKISVEDVPKVVEVTDTLFHLKCVLTRPRWFSGSKIDAFNHEFRNLCAFDRKTEKIDEGVTVSSNPVGDKIFLKIMKGETALITVKDILKDHEDFFMDASNKQPVIWGVDANGVPIMTDFNKLTGLFLSGAPRTGKSWAVKSVISQLMLFNSPTDLQFHFIDPKGPTSDFYNLWIPHVRSFNSEIDEIIELLRYLTNDEAKRREKILSETGEGYVNIEDFKKEHPTYELPYIIVVIDEIMTLSTSMSKDEKTQFFGYLKAFVTRLPGYGIRLVMIPHLVKNSVVDKSVTDMLPNKIVVKGDAKVVEDTLDVKPKDFPYALTHVGDMAVKFADSVNVMFVHSAVLGSTNKSYTSFFDFLTELWLKIDTKSFKNSRLQKALIENTLSLSNYPVLEQVLDKDEYTKLKNSILSQKLKSKYQK